MLPGYFKQPFSGLVFTKKAQVKILKVIVMQSTKHTDDFNNGTTTLILIRLETQEFKLLD